MLETAANQEESTGQAGPSSIPFDEGELILPTQRGWSAISCLFFGWIMVDS